MQVGIVAVAYCTIALIVLYLGAVLWDMSDRPRQAVREPTWEPREIPQCDKPLWERIEDGC